MDLLLMIVRIIPRLHGPKDIWMAIQKITDLHVTFIVQYNKAHHIVVHCSVIVTSQST